MLGLDGLAFLIGSTSGVGVVAIDAAALRGFILDFVVALNGLALFIRAASVRAIAEDAASL